MARLGILLIVFKCLSVTCLAQAGSVLLIPSSGVTTSHPSITAAYAAIPASPAVNYTIELSSRYNGTDVSEVYPIQLTDKKLALGGPSITIRPAAENNAAIIQRPAAAPGTVLQINGGDNIIIDGRPGGVTSSHTNYLHVKDEYQGSNSNRNIELLNGANNNIIQYINSGSAYSLQNGTGAINILIGGTTNFQATSATTNSNNIIRYCKLTGGLVGISDEGFNELFPNTNNKFISNIISHFGQTAILAGSAQVNSVISGNEILLNDEVQVTGDVAGIRSLATLPGSISITGNYISLEVNGGSTLKGISVAGVDTVIIDRNAITNLFSASAARIAGIETIENGRSVSFTISKNSITNVRGNLATSVIGIDVKATNSAQQQKSSYTVFNNNISGLRSAILSGITGLSLSPQSNAVASVHNNMLAIADPGAPASLVNGILLSNDVSHKSALHFNSIKIGGTGGNTITSFGINRAEGINNAIDMQNNLVVTERSGSVAFYNHNSTITNETIYNSNHYYGAGATANSYAVALKTQAGSIRYYANGELGLYAQQVFPQEQKTTAGAVSFVSASDLHLSGVSIIDAMLKGTAVPGITIDIDGNNRSSTAPAKGADEPGGPVPVIMYGFTGTAKGEINYLEWSTASESNNKGFEVQRSADATDFRSIGFVNAQSDNGSSASNIHYRFQDLKPFSTITYYRLKQVDRDGRGVFSNLVMIRGRGASRLNIANIYPNPVGNQATMVLTTTRGGFVNFLVTDLVGRTFISKVLPVKMGDNIIPINTANFGPGVYLVRVIHQHTLEMMSAQFVK